MKFEYNGNRIKIITIKQPYASMIIDGIKDIENRTWNIKIYDDHSKNWLFVHSSSRLPCKKELIKLVEDDPELDKYLTNPSKSCIIGMMHINCVGNLTESVNKTRWSYGPKCWYIDAVIKFKQPIITTSKLGKWDPDQNIHKKLKKQIDESMYGIIQVDNIEFIKKDNIYYVSQRGRYMTWEEVIESLIKKSNILIYKFIQCLLSVEYKSYFWECDKVNMKVPFRFAIFDSKTLSERTQDNTAFSGVINNKKNVIVFPSITKDVKLVVPCKLNEKSEYTSLSTFSRTAPICQQVAFWKKLAENIKDDDWVSTSGLGVSWLHVRITSRPKYYHDAFDKNPIKNVRKNMEEFVNGFIFPKTFTNVIIVGKKWKELQEQDMITNYLELLPKNTNIICVNENIQQKINKIKFTGHYIIYKTDWKKYGRFGKHERNVLIIGNNIDLITIFGGNEEDIVNISKIKKIKILELK
jgi:hypothetical protein